MKFSKTLTLIFGLLLYIESSFAGFKEAVDADIYDSTKHFFMFSPGDPDANQLLDWMDRVVRFEIKNSELKIKKIEKLKLRHPDFSTKGWRKGVIYFKKNGEYSAFLKDEEEKLNVAPLNNAELEVVYSTNDSILLRTKPKNDEVFLKYSSDGMLWHESVSPFPPPFKITAYKNHFCLSKGDRVAYSDTGEKWEVQKKPELEHSCNNQRYIKKLNAIVKKLKSMGFYMSGFSASFYIDHIRISGFFSEKEMIVMPDHSLAEKSVAKGFIAVYKNGSLKIFKDINTDKKTYLGEELNLSPVIDSK